ncbi:MAG: mechanosensitive ion channel [Lachnospiraceae bacterium]|nr:mechanosensitive ion channel [Lachnospiraceae bacterium]
MLLTEVSYFEKLIGDIPDKLMGAGIKILIALVIFIIGRFVIRFIAKFMEKSMTKFKVETGAMQFAVSLVKVMLFVVMTVCLAIYLGVDTASMVALLGSAGVAIGLALQGSLANLAGGMLILFVKPFKVGDYIIEKSTNTEGTVKEIQLFYTKLVTADNRRVVLPNGNLSNNTVINVTGEKFRRMDLSLGISYSSDIRTAKDVMTEAVKKQKYLAKDKDVVVFVDELGDSAIKLTVRFYVETRKFWDVRYYVLEDIKTALDENGIVIPFPQLDVRVKD